METYYFVAIVCTVPLSRMTPAGGDRRNKSKQLAFNGLHPITALEKESELLPDKLNELGRRRGIL